MNIFLQCVLSGIVLVLSLPYNSADTNYGVTPSDEARLVKMLTSRYEEIGTIARPIYNSTEKITIYMGLRLIQVDIDELTQSFSVKAWVRMRWNDEYLTWNETEYGGLKYTTLPMDKIWTPTDIDLVNTVEAEVKQKSRDLEIRNDGRVFLAPFKEYRAACLIDVSRYPYDQHTCNLWFQSTSRHSFFFDLQPYIFGSSTPWDLSTFKGSFDETQDWEVVEGSNITEYVASPKDIGVNLMYARRPSLKFSITLKRKPGFTAVVLLLPCVFLSFLTTAIFCLPPTRPDRHMLAMSLFTSFVILLLVLVSKAPPSASSVPKLGVFYCFNMIVIIASIFVSIFVVYVSRRPEHKTVPSRWVQTLFFKVLARMFHMESRVDELDRCDGYATPANGSDEKPDLSAISSNEGGALQMAKESDRPSQEQIVLQWTLITSLLDRFFFCVFLFINIISIVFMFPWPW